MPAVRISEDMYRLLFDRARRESRKLEHLLNDLLHKVLWNEPGLLFKGKHYKVNEDLFGENIPKQGEIED